MENGVRSYSTDGGKTWSTTAPDGVTVSDKDGKVTIMNGTLKMVKGKACSAKWKTELEAIPQTAVRPGAQRSRRCN